MSQGHNDKALKDVGKLLEVEPHNKEGVLLRKTLKETTTYRHDEGTNLLIVIALTHGSNITCAHPKNMNIIYHDLTLNEKKIILILKNYQYGSIDFDMVFMS